MVAVSQQLIVLVPEAEGDSKRIRWFPNERLVRYYTTLGLLDRPAAMKGRTAYYSWRHVLQVLAIKSLQVAGHSLQECQQRLAGSSDQELVAIIGLPADYRSQLFRDEGPSEETPAPARRFWERAPAEPTPAPPRPRETFRFKGLELAPGVQLVLDKTLYPDVDPALLRQAAANLIEVLKQQTEDK